MNISSVIYEETLSNDVQFVKYSMWLNNKNNEKEMGYSSCCVDMNLIFIRFHTQI